MKFSRRLIYTKINKFMPYDIPFYLQFVKDKVSQYLNHEDIKLETDENVQISRVIENKSQYEEEKVAHNNINNNSVLYSPENEDFKRMEEESSENLPNK